MPHPIHLYHAEVEKLKDYGGTKKETAIRSAFYNLLNDYARQRGLMMVAEVSIKTPGGKTVTPDGTLKDSLRQDWGYWESKDEADDLDEEIRKKFEKGYPKDNILFEDSRVAVLIQKGKETLRCFMSDENALHLLLTEFFSFERPEVQNFHKAIELFKQDVPKVTDTIRTIIVDAALSNVAFIKALTSFLELCRDSINPVITREDVYEMIIQHILTEDIFNTIFDETQFHRENNIARELESVIATFFTGSLRRETLHGIKHYYDTINAAAAGIADHHEKQKFLKVVYETFYKSYNPKAADRLGVVYTPNEIVRFMIESADYLLYKYFDKYLEDPNVEILDPATGTGTFICDLIDHIRKEKLEYKYRNEIHANEVAILPYYISNLNIEFTYAQKMGRYVEFENLCFVDTLDNMGFSYKGKQSSLDFFSEENSRRIQKQNEKKISVIIGNPPYNANQANENDNNKNRGYPEIDKRIKDTFIKYSTAQKTKVYDMYARFYRWAFDRLDDNGIVAFVTNRSFIDSRTFDGFRKTIQQEFEAAYIIDTLSDVRANPKIAGTTHNVFGIQTGVAIMFLVKKVNRENEKCKIHYFVLDDFWRKGQKLQWLAQNQLRNIPFEIIRPDKNNNWINLADNDFESLLSLCSKNAKLGRGNETLFELYSNGIVSARDEWVFDLSKDNLITKVRYFIMEYTKQLKSKRIDNDSFDYTIKWSEALKSTFKRKSNITFDKKKLVNCLYRPFHVMIYYSEKKMSDRLTSLHFSIFGKNIIEKNSIITFSGGSSSKPFSALAIDKIFSLDFLEKTQCLPLYRYNKNGNRIDNITDWGLQQFVEHYSSPPTPLHFGEGGRTVETQIPPQLLVNARELRKNQTEAEELLWQLLRGRQLCNLKFRRQHPLKAGFILDFYCAEIKLGIEIDGGYHTQLEQQEYDADRTQIINEYGISIIRFTNDEVLKNTTEVLKKILNSSPHPPSPNGEGQGVRKTDIFHYIYAVLHNPAYRKKYELNLKREFPRIPFYDDFHKWASWGEQLMNLHVNYESVEPYPLVLSPIPSPFGEGQGVRCKLKADKESGIIILDDETELHGIPPVAWEYKLGNRSALEWILDQYQEKKPKDLTIAEHFNTYRFADYKEQVIDLLKRVCTVSVETMRIMGEMENSSPN